MFISKKKIGYLEESNKYLANENRNLKKKLYEQKAAVDELYSLTYGLIGAVIEATGKSKLTVSSDTVAEFLRKKNLVVEYEDGDYFLVVEAADGKEKAE